MEIKFKMSMNVPEELAKALNLNEETAFQTYYEDGKIYIETIDAEGFLTEEDSIKMLLSGEMNTIVIDDCHYAAFELLDQEVETMQTDIFDGNLIRMKTGGYEEPDFEMTM